MSADAGTARGCYWGFVPSGPAVLVAAAAERELHYMAAIAELFYGA